VAEVVGLLRGKLAPRDRKPVEGAKEKPNLLQRKVRHRQGGHPRGRGNRKRGGRKKREALVAAPAEEGGEKGGSNRRDHLKGGFGGVPARENGGYFGRFMERSGPGKGIFRNQKKPVKKEGGELWGLPFSGSVESSGRGGKKKKKNGEFRLKDGRERRH